MNLTLFNTLTRKKELFAPIQDSRVGLYTCGPTVYNFAHIGNLRTYIFQDILKRVLMINGYNVTHIMNITDVGHLTGDRDMGEDKMEEGARREGKTAWDIAAFYTDAFKKDLDRLNVMEPTHWVKATETIEEQIALIRTLEEKGYTYRTSDGIYYDTSLFKEYTKLSHQKLESLKEGARVERNAEKKNSTDFALWKFAQEGVKRQMEWDSPWGKGFPGWHVECSAMSMMYLDGQMDIHCGGTDHIDVHHTNEIAQSEAATGRPFFNYWLHGAFLIISGGKKMAKSEDNFLTLDRAFIDKSIDPLVFRFATFQNHYRKPMEYSDESVQAASNGLEHLKNQIRHLMTTGFPLESRIDQKFHNKFLSAVNDDLNIPKALAVIQELLKSNLHADAKLSTVMNFDKVLGLNLDKLAVSDELPPTVQNLVEARMKARTEKNWALSDELRDEITRMGYSVKDSKNGMNVNKI